ncbi:hypothetical protein ABZ848_07380 [Streptomyces sp. NPDC047081]|uniref:hypothetical protein n=1 Tax=Streptomyces sp. NPDC047081 TaxID=3154706 RepID=UPI00340DB64A
MSLFLLVVSMLCLSGYAVVYSLSPPGRAASTGTAAQDEAAFLVAELRARLADVEAGQAGLHRERAHLLGWLAALHHRDALLTAAPDVDEPGWKLLHLDVAGHGLSWHIAPRDVELFEHVTSVPFSDPRVRRDGGTTEETYRRIRSLTLSREGTAVRAVAGRPNIDALLDGYAHRGAVIKQALRLVDTVIDTPPTGATEQHRVHDFAHRIRHALLVSSPKTDA